MSDQWQSAGTRAVVNAAIAQEAQRTGLTEQKYTVKVTKRYVVTLSAKDAFTALSDACDLSLHEAQVVTEASIVSPKEARDE